jgi:type II restriction/modification system DNA methylase subunit YeeA
MAEIFADLTARDGEGSGVDLTLAKKLPQNAGCAYVATVKAGPFDIPGDTARAWLKLPNPNGKSNANVLRPWANGMDMTRRPSDTWIVDFGVDMPEAEAALYEVPFAHVRELVYSQRTATTKETKYKRWWLMARPIPAMRVALAKISRFIATPVLAKHRLFVWMDTHVLADHQLIAVARDDDTTFGILHSRFHELWALRLGTSLEDRPRYTPSTTFETFPFPEGLTPNIPAATYANDARAQHIAKAARALVEARDRWLNPPDWTDRVPEVVTGYPDRIVAKPEHAAELKKRTLTNLYNARPAWLDNLHRSLDEAVAAAYGWPWPLSDDDILRRLFELNQARAR